MALVRRLATELGLLTLAASSRDVKLLLLSRFLRLLAYGSSTLFMVHFLDYLSIPSARIGLFMTLTLLGDVGISLLLTLFADTLGRRLTLILGCGLMIASGVTFAISKNYWILLVAAVIGVISPGGTEIGPFRAVEESVLAGLCDGSQARTEVFAWYTMVGALGRAIGQLITGWFVRRLLVEGIRKGTVYRGVFWAYAGIGVLKLVLACSLSHRIELAGEKLEGETEEQNGRMGETAPLLADAETTEQGPLGGEGLREEPLKTKRKALLPRISKASRAIVAKLSCLFALDSFAAGLVAISWQSYFFSTKFALPPSTVGDIFFASNLLSSLSTLAASSIAKRIGLIPTMVLTHLPSSIFLTLIPLPNSALWATTFLLLRSCTKSMDTAPRQAFLAAVVSREERTAVMGFVNVVKTLCQSAGPSVTGVLVGDGRFWLTFVVAGSLKALYDIGVVVMFWGHQIEEKWKGKEDDEGEDGENEHEQGQFDERVDSNDSAVRRN